MSLQITTNINVDFCDNEYIMINAKQYDSSSRWISITCYNEGKLYNLNASKHAAYIKYRKADGNGILNSCAINYKGEVLVELTEQMLSVDGTCYAELTIVNKGSAMVNFNTGEIIAVDNTPILSTMAFCVNVYEASVDNSLIESVYEYEPNTLNQLLEEANANYSEVYLSAKSWAVGHTGIRDGENTNNSEYWSEQSKSWAVGDTDERSGEDTNNSKYWSEQSEDSANNAATSESNAKTSETNAKTSEVNAKLSEDNSKASETNAKTSEDNAKVSETNAKTSEVNAKTSEVNADVSETNAKTSETNASTSEQNAKTSETNALNSANKAQSYAENAQHYYDAIESIVDGLESGFIPMGTVSFAELATVEKATGYVYNIHDDFVTDDEFREGSGKHYTAGTNVYFTASGLWDCFGGAASPTATVDEVKDYLGI